MYAIFSDAAGRREGLVLAVGPNRFRLVVRGSLDATELKYNQGRWALETGAPAEIEFLTMEADSASFAPLTLPATAVHRQVA